MGEEAHEVADIALSERQLAEQEGGPTARQPVFTSQCHLTLS